MENKVEEVSWRNVHITPEMPLDAIVGFLNVLNNRLCTIEDVITVNDPKTNQPISLTQYYINQNNEAQAEANKQE